MSDSKEFTTKFNGQLDRWPAFEKMMKAKALGVKGYNIIWNDNGVHEEIPVLPPVPPEDCSQRVYDMWKMEKDSTEKKIKEYLKRESELYTIITNSVDEKLLEILIQSNGDPRLAMHLLREKYGPSTQSARAIADLKEQLRNTKMQENETFANFMIKFESLKIMSHSTDEDALGALTSQTNPILPERLWDKISECIDEELDYRNTVLTLEKKDNRLYREKKYVVSDKSETKKIVKRIREKEDESDEEPSIPKKVKFNEKPCPNCKNTGHAPKDCKLDACSFCKKWECGHVGYNCPIRLKKNKGDFNSKGNKSSNDKKSKKVPTKNNSKRENSKKKSGFRVTKNDSEEDDDDSVILDCSDYDSDSSEEGDMTNVRQPRRARRIAVRKVGSFTKPKSSAYKFRVDSGADVTCARSKDVLTETTDEYCLEKEQELNQVYAADGSAMKCIAKGNINEFLTDVHVLPDLDENLLAVGPLQEQGFWAIFPPPQAKTEHTCYICDGNGKIILGADSNMRVDVRKTYENYPNIILPSIFNPNRKVMRAGVYGFNATTLYELIAFWHNALNHPSLESMCKIADSKSIDGFNLTSKQIRAHWVDCVACIKGKMTKRPVHRKQKVEKIESFTSVGQVIARDLYQTGNLKGVGGLTSFETFVDHKSGFINVCPIKSKKDVIANLINVHGFYDIRRHKISVIRSDSEAVYKSEEMKKTCTELKMSAQYDIPYTHATLVEIRHRLIGNKVTSMFAAAPHAPHNLFFEAVKYAVFTENLLIHPHSNGKSAYETVMGMKPDVFTIPLLPWACPVEVHVPIETRHGKFESKSATCMFVGVAEDYRDGITVYNPENNTFLVRNQYVVLPHVPTEWPRYNKAMRIPNCEPVPSDEAHRAEIPAIPETVIEEPKSNILPEPTVQEGVVTPEPEVQEGVLIEEIPKVIPAEEIQIVSAQEGDMSEEVTLALPEEYVPHISPFAHVTVNQETAQGHTHTRSGRPIKTPSRYANKADKRERAMRHAKESRDEKVKKLHNGATRAHKLRNSKSCIRKVQKKRTDDNPTYKKAIDPSNPSHMQWKAAISTEENQMEEEYVYDVNAIDDMTEKERFEAIRCHFVLTLKRDAEGKVEKYKARFVAGGDRQSKNTYDDIKSPTARSASVKLAAAIAAKLKLKVRVFDVKGAYLKVKVKDGQRLFIRLPDGRYARLLKYLYGLKQAGLMWHEEIKSLLLSLGYTQSTADECVFTFMKGDDYVNIVLHVDDLFCTATSDRLLDKLYKQLKKAYGEVTFKDGESFTYLGMKVRVTDEGILLSQPGAIDKLVNEADMEGASPASTPQAIIPSVLKDGDDLVDVNEYLKLLGMINYIAVQTRPDLLYVLSTLSKKASSPNKADFHALKRVIRYLIGTRHLGLFFRSGGEVKLTCMVDASYNTSDNAKSQTGYIFRLGDKNDAVFYARSSKQNCVALSSTEAEYVAMCEAATEIVWLRQLLSDMGLRQEEPTVVYEDNLAAIKIAHGAGTHQRTKHINVRYHYTRQLIQDGIIEVVHKRTDKMLADLLTKGLPRPQYEKLRDEILQTYY